MVITVSTVQDLCLWILLNISISIVEQGEVKIISLISTTLITIGIILIANILNYNLSPEEVQGYLAELDAVLQEAEETAEYKKIVNLPKLKEAGKVGEYYYTIDTMIFNWKQKYKNGME